MLPLLILFSIITKVLAQDAKIFFIDVAKNENGVEHAQVELHTNMEENKIYLMSAKAPNSQELETSIKWKVKKHYIVEDNKIIYINLKNLPNNYNYCFSVDINNVKYFSAAFYKNKNGKWIPSCNADMCEGKKKKKHVKTNNVVKNYINFNLIRLIMFLSLLIML